MLENKSITCPIDRNKHSFENIESVPINYQLSSALKADTKSQKTKKKS